MGPRKASSTCLALLTRFRRAVILPSALDDGAVTEKLDDLTDDHDIAADKVVHGRNWRCGGKAGVHGARVAVSRSGSSATRGGVVVSENQECLAAFGMRPGFCLF